MRPRPSGGLWRSSSTNVNYHKFTGVLYGQNIDVSATTLLLNLNNQFSFQHGWSGEVSGFYRTKGVEGRVIVDPLGQGTAAISKKILGRIRAP